MLPSGGQIRDLAISPVDGTVYALSRYGGAYRTLDDGASWTACGRLDASTIDVDAAGGLFASGSTVFLSTNRCDTFMPTGAPTAALAVGALGNNIYSLGDTALWIYGGGTTWNQVITGLEGDFFMAFGGYQPSGMRIVGTYDSYIAVSPNGTNWTQKTAGIPTASIVDISVGAARAYVLSGATANGNGGVGCSDGTGATWTTCMTTGGTAMAMDPTDEQHVVVATYDQFGETSNAFTQFAVDLREPSGLDEAIVRDLQYTSSGVLWAATDRGVFKSTTRPLAFVPALSGIAAWSINDIVRSGDDVYLATEGGVLHSRAGAPFTLSTEGIIYNTNASRIAVASNGTLLAAGRGIWGSTDQGQNWTNLGLFANTDGYYGESVTFVGTRAYIGTYAGTVHRADPPYVDWTAFDPFAGTSNIFEIAGTQSELYLATESGLYVSTNAGQSATPNAAVTGVSCGAIVRLADGGYAAGCANGVWLSNPERTQWTMSLAQNVHRIVMASDGRIVAITFSNGVFVSANRGESWSMIDPSENVISALYDEADGSLVLGTAGHGLVRAALP